MTYWFLPLYFRWYVIPRLSIDNFSIKSLCFSMTEFQHLGSIIIPSKTPLLFICLIAWVSSVESSSREEKHHQHIGSFNFGNKSKSGGLMSGLYSAWGNTSHPQSRRFLVTTSTMCGRVFSWRMSGPAMSNWGWFLCIFWRSFCSCGSIKFFTCCATIFFKSVCHKLQHFFHLLLFSTLLVLSHCLYSHSHHEND